MVWGNMRNLVVLFSLILVGIGDGASAEIYFRKGAPHVKLANEGILAGKTKFSRDGRPYNAFTSIKYATAERFQEPKLVTEADWSGVKNATERAPFCVQTQFGDGVATAPLSTLGVEDCLYLNVHVPMVTPRKNSSLEGGFPVMVYVHGGSLIVGSGSEYDPVFFMDEDVIVITINYRLGVFGFLSTGDSLVPGNNGLKDTIVALQWVQRNIKNFGGDPGKVTIFGESSGGTIAHFMYVTPKAEGLIHGAIVQSGSVVECWSHEPNPKLVAAQLARFMKCPTPATGFYEISSQEMLDCFKNAKLEELTVAQAEFTTSWPQNLENWAFRPVKEPKDGKTSSVSPIITESPYAIITNRKQPFPKIPLMLGIMEDEGAVLFAGFVLQNPELLNEINDNWNEVAPLAFDYYKLVPDETQDIVSEKIRKFYFGSKNISTETRENFSNLYSDQIISHGMYKSAVETAARGSQNPVYLYQFACPVPKEASFLLPSDKELAKKVSHATDLLYQFQMEWQGVSLSDMIPPDTPLEELSKNVVKLWASFATDGKPTHTWGNSSTKKWNPLTKRQGEGKEPLTWYRIEKNPGHIGDPYKERNAFWSKLYKDHLEQAYFK